MEPESQRCSPFRPERGSRGRSEGRACRHLHEGKQAPGFRGPSGRVKAWEEMPEGRAGGCQHPTRTSSSL